MKIQKSLTQLFLIMIILILNIISVKVAGQSYTQTSYDMCSSATCGIYAANATSNPNLKLICTLSGSTATFRVEKCSGTFSSSGTIKIIVGGSLDEPCTGTTIKTAAISTASTGYTFSSYTLTNSNYSLWFYAVYTNAANNNYYAGCIKITPIAEAPTATTLSASTSPISAILNGSVNPKGFGTSVYFQYGLTSSLGNTTASQSIGNGTSTQTVQETISGLSLLTKYYYRIVATNSGGTTYGSILSFETPDPWISPTVNTSGTSNITLNSAVISGSVNPNGYATSYLFKYGTTTSMNNNTSSVNLGNGTSTQQVNANLTNLLENTTYYYAIYAASTNGSGNIQNVQGTTQQFKTNTQSPISLQLSSEMGFYESSSSSTKITTLEIGKTYYFKASIKNIGGTNFSGNFYLKKGLGASYSNYISFLSNTISTNGVKDISGTFTPSIAESNISLGLYYSDGGANQGQVSGESYLQNIVISTQSAIVSECDLTELSTSSAYYEPTLFLCQRGVISGSQDGAVNVTDFLKRSHLAKIAFKGLYRLFNRTIPTNLPSDFYPSIYPDLNVQTTTNEYYYQAAKVLMYLEYGDGISPFDRNKTNFNPENFITRADVLKVLFEAFDIKPDLTNINNPFPEDANVADLLVNNPVKFGYIRKAADLGIIATPTSTNKEFRPFDNCTRGEAFILLYRIMQKIEAGNQGITDPATVSEDYFEPLNITLQTISLGLTLPLGNFNHYTKTSFALDGVVPLSFSHTYDSYSTNLPDEFYGEKDLGNNKIVTYKPLGSGWSHEYHSFATMIENQIVVHWGGGKIDVYNWNTTLLKWKAESIGVYDDLSVDGSVLLIKTKSQMQYRFARQSTTGPNVVELYSIKDRNNNELVIHYTSGQDGAKVISSVSDGNRELNFSYLSGTNLISQVTDPLGRTIKFAYTFNSTSNEYLLTSFTDAKNQETKYFYGLSSNMNKCKLLEKIQLPKGNYIQNTYEANRRLQKSVTGVNGIPTVETSITVNANYQNNTMVSTVQVDREVQVQITITHSIKTTVLLQ
ncbi:MAG: S-layer homology domain-containing protein [Draconibacterium sp.]|nr:S-layer homology domain-containing protein [Draconibacterium sp.]